MADWSPATYLKFEDERTRPARDLLAQVPLEVVRKAVDVGCGPGNSTELLAARYPDAEIIGIDNSMTMLAEAAKRLPKLRFENADANKWMPAASVDLVYANATYQWIPDHITRLPKVLSVMRPGTVLAVQMPDNLAEPTHRLMSETARELGTIDAARAVLPPPTAYYDALKPQATRIDIWHTIYNHALADSPAIVEWVRATGLRPFIDPLSEDKRAAFLAAYTAKIAAAYPPTADGKVLLRFPRIFIVAQR